MSEEKYKSFEELKEELGKDYDYKLYEMGISALKEIDRLNNIIKDLLKDIEVIVECEDINIIKMQLRNCLYKLNELKE